MITRLLPFLFLLSFSVSAEVPGPDTVAATFNGKNITYGTIENELKRQPMLGYQMSKAADEKAKNEVRVQVVNALIDRELLVDEAVKKNAISDKDLEKSVSDFITQNYKSEKELEPMLSAVGTDLPKFKNDLKNGFRIQALLEKELKGPVTPSDEELKKLFDANPARYATKEGVHARHILIKFPEGKPADKADAEAKAKIDGIYSEVSKPGSDFAAIAKEKSECPSAPQGGDLGTFGRGVMVPEFEKAAFSLKPGEISQPVKTQFGYHIIKVEEKQTGAAPNFADAKATLVKEYTAMKRSETVKARIAELRKQAKIDIKIPT